MQAILIFLVLLIVAAEGLAMSSIQMSSLNSAAVVDVFLILGLFFYAVVAILLKQSFTIKKMGSVNALWSALSVVSVAAASALFFKETFTGLELFGISLAVVATAIMSA